MKVQGIKNLLPPKSWRQVYYRSDKQAWYDAYDKEILNMESIGGLNVVEPPKGEKVWPLLELFSY